MNISRLEIKLTKLITVDFKENGYMKLTHIGSSVDETDSLTICGLIEDDDVHIKPAEPGAVVDCPACKSMWKACQAISPEHVAGMGTPSDDYQEPVLTTCERCGRDDWKKRAEHFEANHNSLVMRCALLRQRPDLPVDRIPAYNALVKTQARNVELEAKLTLVREQRDNELRTNLELERRLATPVQLPEREFDDGSDKQICILAGRFNSAIDKSAEAIRAAGFRCERGD